MKKIILIIILLIWVNVLPAQNAPHSVIKDLKYWKSINILSYFPDDLDTLSKDIDTLNIYILLPFKKNFDSNRMNISKKSEIFIGSLIKTTIPKIEYNILTIKKRIFFGTEESKNIGKSNDSSFLFYYANKELNDYLGSLQSLAEEMNLLLPKYESHLNSFTINNFLNSYYFMCESRSLLLAAMDNLERYYNLGGMADSIQKITDTTRKVADSLNKYTQRIDTNVITTKTNVLFMTDTLFHPFYPYYKMGKTSKSVKELIGSDKDKISSSANTILYDNRRNWWWRTLICGIVGGLTAGLLVHSLK